MDDRDLVKIEARHLAATKGLWESFIEGRDHFSGDSFIRTGGVDNGNPDLYLTGATLRDQDFIAHARQDIPRLVSEVRRPRALLASNGARI